MTADEIRAHTGRSRTIYRHGAVEKSVDIRSLETQFELLGNVVQSSEFWYVLCLLELFWTRPRRKWVRRTMRYSLRYSTGENRPSKARNAKHSTFMIIVTDTPYHAHDALSMAAAGLGFFFPNILPSPHLLPEPSSASVSNLSSSDPSSEYPIRSRLSSIILPYSRRSRNM